MARQSDRKIGAGPGSAGIPQIHRILERNRGHSRPHCDRGRDSRIPHGGRTQKFRGVRAHNRAGSAFHCARPLPPRNRGLHGRTPGAIRREHRRHDARVLHHHDPHKLPALPQFHQGGPHRDPRIQPVPADGPDSGNARQAGQGERFLRSHRYQNHGWTISRPKTC